jgi:hypothetical protein
MYAPGIVYFQKRTKTNCFNDNLKSKVIFYFNPFFVPDFNDTEVIFTLVCLLFFKLTSTKECCITFQEVTKTLVIYFNESHIFSLNIFFFFVSKLAALLLTFVAFLLRRRPPTTLPLFSFLVFVLDKHTRLHILVWTSTDKAISLYV